jgi:hypothetical protein
MTQKSRAARLLIWMFLAGQLIFFGLSWSPAAISLPGMAMQMAPGGMGFDEARGLAGLPRLWGLVLAIPSVGAMVYGLWRLDRLLLIRSDKAMFSLRGIGHLRAFAGATALSTVLSIAEVPARGLVFRHAFGIEQAHIKVGVSSSEILLVLVCLMFYLIADLMHEARRIAQENESFV